MPSCGWRGCGRTESPTWVHHHAGHRRSRFLQLILRVCGPHLLRAAARSPPAPVRPSWRRRRPRRRVLHQHRLPRVWQPRRGAGRHVPRQEMRHLPRVLEQGRHGRREHRPLRPCASARTPAAARPYRSHTSPGLIRGVAAAAAAAATSAASSSASATLSCLAFQRDRGAHTAMTRKVICAGPTPPRFPLPRATAVSRHSFCFVVYLGDLL